MPGIASLGVLFFFLLLIPYGAWKTRARIPQLVALPREVYFRKVVTQQVLFAALAGLAVYADHVRVSLGRVDLPLIAVAILAVIVFVKLMQPRWRAAVKRQDARTLFIAPRNGRESAWWIAVSVAAGVCEEFVWRGVVAGIIWWLSDDWWTAALVTSVAFGAAHIVQGLRAAVIIGLASFAIQGYVYWAGGILLAMVIHASYDIVAGLTYGKLCDEAGIPLDATADVNV
ncbi:MAG: CPBP family intramembrane glutamic endopeptidase [Gemmatimonadota bacterium]